MLSIPARHLRLLSSSSKLVHRTSASPALSFISLPTLPIHVHCFSSKKFETQRPEKPFSVVKKIEVERPEKSLAVIFKDFNQITKLKLGVLNTWVTLTTFMMYGGSICSSDCIILAFATQFMAMSSQTVNQIIEVEHDKLMNRTKNRPLPQGKITEKQAIALAAALYAGSNYLFIQYLPIQSLFVANSIFFGYILGYTPLKRVSELNTPVGAIVGSLTSYLGWAAAGGSLLAFDPFLVFMWTFCWQFPHFYGILWTYKDDYKRGGFKMLECPEKAYTQIKYSLAGQIACVGGLLSTGAIDPISASITWYMLYKYGYKPMNEFGADPNFKTARKMTITSYAHFTILFAFIYINLALKTWGYDKKIKRALGIEAPEIEHTNQNKAIVQSN